MGERDITFAGLTDVGLTREHNEDYYGFFEPEERGKIRGKGRLFVVCDGMGGHAAGEVASRMAVETMGKVYYDVPRSPLEALKYSIEAANKAIYDEAQKDPDRKGMGTTVSALALVGKSAIVANVGDSRTYLVRDDTITQISEDHSWVMEQVRAGNLTHEEAKDHPYGNVITRSLGSKPDVKVDVFSPLDIEQGDKFLLMSDGLSGLVSDEELLSLSSSLSPREAADRLVMLAKERGGHDNITVQIVTVNRVKGKRIRVKGGDSGARIMQRRHVIFGSIVVALVILLGLAIFIKKGGREVPGVGEGPTFQLEDPVDMLFIDGTLFFLEKGYILPITPPVTDEAPVTSERIPIPGEIGRPIAMDYEYPEITVIGLVTTGEKDNPVIAFPVAILDLENNNTWSMKPTIYNPKERFVGTPDGLVRIKETIYFILGKRIYRGNLKNKHITMFPWELESPAPGISYVYYKDEPCIIYVDRSKDGSELYCMDITGRSPERVPTPTISRLSEQFRDIVVDRDKNILYIGMDNEIIAVDFSKEVSYKIPGTKGRGIIREVAPGDGNVLYLLIEDREGLKVDTLVIDPTKLEEIDFFPPLTKESPSGWFPITE